MKRILSATLSFLVFVSGGLTANCYYDALSNAYNDPTESVMEFEAEDFTYTEGFEVADDAGASGGKVLKSTTTGSTAVIDVNFEKPISEMVLYAEHKATDEESNLSYIYFDNMDGEPVYTTSYNTFEAKRVWYGDAFGSYKLYIRSVRPGHMVDKVIIKYNTGSESTDLSGEFIPANPEAESFDLPEVKETALGSYFFEAESGKYGGESIATGYDAEASGGAYWYSESGTQADPLANNEANSRFKFKVNEKGKYRLWVRYYNTAVRASWFGMDGADYVNNHAAASTAWTWRNLKTFNLDEGWHTFDIKYNTSGQYVDCCVLTNQMWFTPVGKGSLPGEKVNPDSRLIAAREKAIKDTRIWINGVRSRADVPVEKIDGVLTVPVSNMAKLLGLEKKTEDDYILLSRGRQYAKIYLDSPTAVINGRQVSTVIKPKQNSGVYSVPFFIFRTAFLLDSEFDEGTNNLYLFDMYEENAREAKDGEIVILPNYIGDINIKIPYDNPNVKIRVFVRLTNNDLRAFQLQNFFDNYKSLTSGGYDYKNLGIWQGDWGEFANWVECPTPYYKDGAFYTRRSEVQNGETSNGENRKGIPHEVMVSIISDSKEDLFVARNILVPDVSLKANTTEEYKINTGGELFAETTFENISYYIDYELGAAKSCKVTYRKAGDEEWKKAHDPMNDKKTGQFRGSIVKAEENTEYEIKAVLYDESGKIVTQKLTTVKTKTTDVPIAKTIKLSEIYDGEGSLQLQNVCGTEDGWIRIDCEGQEIKAGLNDIEAVYISECHYLVFENAKVSGGWMHGINIANGSTDIHIRNCDISGWGPGDGVYNEVQGLYYVNGYVPNYFAGIKIRGNVENILVERCYIHDANMKTNPWTRPDGVQTHPCGSCGIYVGARGGIVIRYNDFVGSDRHRFNDCIESAGNFALSEAGVCRNSDVYGNMFIYSNDDVMELDGAQMNVRVYENRCEQTLCGISTASTTMGPAYIFNNLITNLGTEQDQTNMLLKNGGGGPDGYIGKLYIFNNTLDADSKGAAGSNGEWHAEMKNNIINAGDGKKTALEIEKAKNNNDDFDIDYNIFWGAGVRMGAKTEGIEHNIRFTAREIMPQYENRSIYDFNLSEGHIGLNGGTWIDGFSEHYVIDGKPDMGAFEVGSSFKMLPNRPIDIQADAYRLDIANGREATVTFHVGDVKSGQKYKIDKNKDYTWLEILSPVSGELVPNSEITVKVKADMTGYEFPDGNGMIMLRTEEGYSVPITVYAYYPQ